MSVRQVKFFAALCMPQIATKHHSIDFVAANRFNAVGEFANPEICESCD